MNKKIAKLVSGFLIITVAFTLALSGWPWKVQEALATAPTFISAGSIAVDTGGGCAITPGPPTHEVGDIIIVSAYNAAGSTMSTVTSGWTEITEIDGTDNIAWYWKRATATDDGGPAITGASTDCFGVAYIIRGAIATGTPYEDATTTGDGTTQDSTPDTATITTTNVDRFVMALVAHDGESAGVTWGSGNPPNGWDSNSNLDTGTGTDAGFYVISKTQASAGDVTSAVVGTMSAATLVGTLTLAFIPQPTAALTGTITASITEADIVAGGKTIILTLNGDNWVAAGATFDAQRQNIINGLDSAQAEGTGWDAVVKAGLGVSAVVRTSATVVTITFTAFASYDITATETITAIIPSTAVVGGAAITATPTFDITTDAVTTLTQNDFEFWYDDDSVVVDEARGTPDVLENSPLNAIPVHNEAPTSTAEIRIRMSIVVTDATLSAGDEGFILQYATSTLSSLDCASETASNFKDVEANGSTAAWVFALSGVTDNTALSIDPPTVGDLKISVADVAGRYSKSNPSNTTPFDVNAAEDLEWDWHVQHNAAGGTTYCFRMIRDDNTELNGYNDYPRLTTAPNTENVMRHGNFFDQVGERGFYWAD